MPLLTAFRALHTPLCGYFSQHAMALVAGAVLVLPSFTTVPLPMTPSAALAGTWSKVDEPNVQFVLTEGGSGMYRTRADIENIGEGYDCSCMVQITVDLAWSASADSITLQFGQELRSSGTINAKCPDVEGMREAALPPCQRIAATYLRELGGIKGVREKHAFVLAGDRLQLGGMAWKRN